MKMKIASVLATAAAVAFVTAPVTSSVALAHGKMVPCYGVNGCKGKSECKTAKNTCKGQNGCKGQGVMMMSEKQCKKAGGSLEETK